MAARKQPPKTAAKRAKRPTGPSRPRKRAVKKHAEPAPLKFRPTGTIAEAYDRVLALTAAFPGIEHTRAYGTPCIKVLGKVMARLRSESEGGLALRCDFADRHMLMQADPRTFYVTDHYLNYPMVLINLEEVRWDAMPGLLETAWRLVAPRRVVEEYDALPR
jgi:hypothetical protein